MAKKQSRKEFVKQMKGPDQYQKVASRVMSWLNDNTMMIWATVLPVVLIIFGVLIWQWYANKQQLELIDSLGKVTAVYRDENGKAQKEREKLNEKLTAIDAKIAKIENVPEDPKDKKKDDDPLKPATPKKKKNLSAAEKKEIAALKTEREGLEKQMQDIKPDHTSSLAEFKNYYQTHSETAQGWVANMQAVAIHLERKELDQARSLLTELLAKSKNSKFYQIHARIVYINLLKDSGDYDTAMKEVEQLEKIAPDSIKPVALLNKAQVLKLKGQNEEALKVLDLIQQDHANSPEADQAKNFRMIVKGV